MAKNAEIKVKISSDGGKAAADDINRVDKAADGASKGGLSSLAGKLPIVGDALSKHIPDGASSASSGIGLLGGAAVAGGAALAAFAVKGVQAFEQGALAAEDFSTATGTSLDTASRWNEVADDLGVGAGTVEAAMGKMNKTLGASPDAFDKYGVSVAHAADGTVDANATFLNAIDTLQGMKNPTEQAAAGAAIFGKGWQGMAQLIATGAPKLREDLASVQPEKIFGAGDVKAAKGVRDGFDAIKDAGEGLMLTLGKSLAPVIAELAPKFGEIITKAGPLVAMIGDGLVSAFETLKPAIDGAIALIGPLAKALGFLGDQVPGVTAALGGSRGGLDDQTKSTKELIAQFVQLDDKYKAVGASGDKFTGDAHAVANALEDQKSLFGSNTDAIDKMTAAVKTHGDEMSGKLIGTISDTANMTEELTRKQSNATVATAAQTESVKAYEAAARTAWDAVADGASAEEEYKKSADAANAATKKASDTLADDMAAGAKKAQRAVDDLKGAFDALKGTVDADQAFLDLETTFDDVRTKAAEAFKAGAEGADDAEEKARAYKSAVNELKGEIIDVAQNVAGISPEDTKKLLMQVDAGQLDAVEAQIATIKANAAIDVTVRAKGGAGYAPRTGRTARAGGGPVTAGESYIVGENRPELFVPDQDGTILPSVPSAGGGRSGGGGTNVNITIHAGMGANGPELGRYIVDAVKKYVRVSGPVTFN